MVDYTPINTLTPGSWVNLDVECIQIWDNDTAAIRQIGILGDDNGIVKFVAWEKSNLPLLQIDTAYTITKLVVSEYEGKKQVALTAKSVITRKGTEQTEIPTA